MLRKHKRDESPNNKALPRRGDIRAVLRPDRHLPGKPDGKEKWQTPAGGEWPKNRFIQGISGAAGMQGCVNRLNFRRSNVKLRNLIFSWR